MIFFNKNCYSFLFLFLFFSLTSCDPPANTSKDGPIVDPIKPGNTEFTDIEIELLSTICDSIDEYAPMANGNQHKFNLSSKTCDNSFENRFSLILKVTADDSGSERKYSYTTSVTDKLFFSGIEQKQFGILSYYCKQLEDVGTGDRALIKRWKENSASLRDYLEIVRAADQSQNKSFKITDGLGCATDVLVPTGAVCIKVTRVFKTKVTGDLQEKWEVSEQEFLSFVIEKKSSFYGMVQFRRRLTNSCSDSSKVVQLYSYFQQ